MSKTELEIHSTDSMQLYGAFVSGEGPGFQDYTKQIKLQGARIVDEKWLVGLVKQRDQLLEALERLVALNMPLTGKPSHAELVEFWEYEKTQGRGEADDQLFVLGVIAAAKTGAAIAGRLKKTERYTSVSKGGSYTKLGAIRGAGSLKGLSGIAYQDDNGGLFIREPECFAKRMVLVEQSAPAVMQSPSLHAQAVGRIKREGGDA